MKISPKNLEETLLSIKILSDKLTKLEEKEIERAKKHSPIKVTVQK